jgi:hypothetical protein
VKFRQDEQDLQDERTEGACQQRLIVWRMLLNRQFIPFILSRKTTLLVFLLHGYGLEGEDLGISGGEFARGGGRVIVALTSSRCGLRFVPPNDKRGFH